MTGLGSVPRRPVVLGAGGVASTVLVHWVVGAGGQAVLLSCDFGGQPFKGVAFAETTAARLGCEHRVADLSSVAVVIAGHRRARAVGGVGLLDRVSNAMAVVLAVGVGLAVNHKADAVLVGVHADDLVVHPDRDASYLAEVTNQAIRSNVGLSTDRFAVRAPLAGLSSAKVMRFGVDLEVSFEDTWSCFGGGRVHFGRCSGAAVAEVRSPPPVYPIPPATDAPSPTVRSRPGRVVGDVHVVGGRLSAIAMWSHWEVGRDLVVAGVSLAGYVWLVTLSLRVRVLRRRLAMHICRDVDFHAARAIDPEDDAEIANGAQKITVADLLDREQGRPRRMLPAATPLAPPEAESEQTQRLAPLPIGEAVARRPGGIGTPQPGYRRAPRRGPDGSTAG